jgi:hypothetical protein
MAVLSLAETFTERVPSAADPPSGEVMATVGAEKSNLQFASDPSLALTFEMIRKKPIRRNSEASVITAPRFVRAEVEKGSIAST